MKCEFCGAEMQTGEKCEYCGSEMPREQAGTESRTIAQDQDFRNGREQSTVYRENWQTDKPAKKKRGCLTWLFLIWIWPISLSVWFYRTDTIRLAKKWKLLILILFWLFAAASAASEEEETVPVSAPGVLETVEEKTVEVLEEEMEELVVLNTETAKNMAAEEIAAVENAVTEIREVLEEVSRAEESTMTMGQRNALGSAHSYLTFTAFSYEGLIRQLEYEQYSHEDAVFAADNCGADWVEQAMKSAENYLEYMSFSYTGLIEQLEFEGFTADQAQYAADNCGADWFEQAAKSAENYLDFMSFSKEGLISQLMYEGYTREQAEYGVKQNGY